MYRYRSSQKAFWLLCPDHLVAINRNDSSGPESLSKPMLICQTNKKRQFDNFFVTGGTVSCHYANLPNCRSSVIIRLLKRKNHCAHPAPTEESGLLPSNLSGFHWPHQHLGPDDIIQTDRWHLPKSRDIPSVKTQRVRFKLLLPKHRCRIAESTHFTNPIMH